MDRIRTVRLRDLSLAAALIAARRWSSSSIRFCLQNLAISLFVTLNSGVGLDENPRNFGRGGGGGGALETGRTIFCFVFDLTPSLSSFLFLIIFQHWIGTLFTLSSRFLSASSVIYQEKDGTRDCVSINCIKIHLPATIIPYIAKYTHRATNQTWNLPFLLVQAMDR